MQYYHVMTGTYLPRSKKIFDCYCKAQEHIKYILSGAQKGLNKEDLQLSIRLTRIDSAKCPNFSTIFLESELKAEYAKKDSNNSLID